MGRAIPIWYAEKDRQTVEEAAALAGYRHLSTFIRDKSLGRAASRQRGQENFQAWADRQELAGLLLDLERSQKSTQVLLAMLVFLVHRKTTAPDAIALLQACESAGVATDLLAAASPQLAAVLSRFTDDR